MKRCQNWLDRVNKEPITKEYVRKKLIEAGVVIEVANDLQPN
jgi:hypothetical protein